MTNQSNALYDLKGAARLACDATVGVTDIVEQMHAAIARASWPVGKQPTPRTRGVARMVYAAIRGTTRVVGKTVDVGLAPLAGVLPDQQEAAWRENLVAALNGIYGDHLERSGNPLATEMKLRVGNTPANPDTRNNGQRFLLLVHGLCMNDRQWNRNGHDHGEALAKDLGYTPVYVRYNSGLSVQENGELLSHQMESLFTESGGQIDELTILGYSLGGLVARSACAQAGASGHAWSDCLRRLVFLGTPHQGAPLEKGGYSIDRILQLSPYLSAFSNLGTSRSRGIQDLRHGLSASGEALPAGVECFALAGSLSAQSNHLHHKLIGDGLVPVASALGDQSGSLQALGIPEAHQWVGYKLGHLALLEDQGVYTQLKDWLN